MRCRSLIAMNSIGLVKVDDRRRADGCMKSVILSRTTHFIPWRRSRGELSAEKFGPNHP